MVWFSGIPQGDDDRGDKAQSTEISKHRIKENYVEKRIGRRHGEGLYYWGNLLKEVTGVGVLAVVGRSAKGNRRSIGEVGFRWETE